MTRLPALASVTGFSFFPDYIALVAMVARQLLRFKLPFKAPLSRETLSEKYRSI